MEKYKYNDNTLMHGILFNIPRLESIMKYGLISEKYAKENGIGYAKNYDGCNLDDSISFVRFLYVNYNDTDSAYSKYIKKGISFIVEDVPFTYSKEERNIHRNDEVLVSSNVPKEKIIGIMIPDKYADMSLADLKIMSNKMNRYHNVKDTCNYIINYLKENNHDFDIEYCKEVLEDLHYIGNEINNSLNNEDLIKFFAQLKKYFSLSELKNITPKIEKLYNNSEIKEEDYQILKKIKEINPEGMDAYREYNDLLLGFQDDISEINEFLASELGLYFDNLLGKESCTVREVVEYLNNKYLNTPIYNVPSDQINKTK